MLLDKPFDLQKGWQEIPFVTGGIYRIGQGLAVVERFEKGIKSVWLVRNLPFRFVSGSSLRRPFRLLIPFGRDTRGRVFL